VSNIVNACANGNFKDELLLAALERAILVFDATSAVSLQHASCIANGLVRLGHAPVPLLVHLAQVLLVFPGGIFPSSTGSVLVFYS
jgi:hypothetical protein